jgi:SAM-dependent methyltransferase
MSAPATRSLPEAVAASAEESVSLLLARATLIGLPENASRVLVFGCGGGHTTVALGDHLGSAFGIDPSAELISCAELAHAGRANCAFAVGGIDELQVLPGRFDLIQADLSRRQLVTKAETSRAVSALVSKLTPGGIVAIGISARGAFRRQGGAFARWSSVADGIAAAGGRVAWTSRREGDAIWIFARGCPAHLRLLPDVHEPERFPHPRV